MLDILLRVLVVAGGLTVAFVFICFGLFFFGWIFSQQENGW